jgi:hypothetical protein
MRMPAPTRIGARRRSTRRRGGARRPAGGGAVVLDADAVRRAGVGDVPAVVVEPDLGVAPARVGAVDAKVTAFVLADDVAPAGNDRVQDRAPRPGAVVDVELAAAAGEWRRRRVDATRAGDRSRAALVASASLQRPSTLTSYGRAIGSAGVVRSAASSSRYSSSSSPAARRPRGRRGRRTAIRSITAALGSRPITSRAR